MNSETRLRVNENGRVAAFRCNCDRLVTDVFYGLLRGAIQESLYIIDQNQVALIAKRRSCFSEFEERCEKTSGSDLSATVILDDRLLLGGHGSAVDSGHD